MDGRIFQGLIQPARFFPNASQAAKHRGKDFRVFFEAFREGIAFLDGVEHPCDGQFQCGIVRVAAQILQSLHNGNPRAEKKGKVSAPFGQFQTAHLGQETAKPFSVESVVQQNTVSSAQEPEQLPYVPEFAPILDGAPRLSVKSSVDVDRHQPKTLSASSTVVSPAAIFWAAPNRILRNPSSLSRPMKSPRDFPSAMSLRHSSDTARISVTAVRPK